MKNSEESDAKSFNHIIKRDSSLFSPFSNEFKKSNNN